MITTVIHPAAVQWSTLSSSIHVSCSIPEGTAISLSAAWRTSVTASRARDAREMSTVSFFFEKKKKTASQGVYRETFLQIHERLLRHLIQEDSILGFPPQVLATLVVVGGPSTCQDSHLAGKRGAGQGSIGYGRGPRALYSAILGQHTSVQGAATYASSAVSPLCPTWTSPGGVAMNALPRRGGHSPALLCFLSLCMGLVVPTKPPH